MTHGLQEIPLPQNVSDLLTNAALRWPSAAAVIHPDGLLSYDELDRLVWALCSRLCHEGVAPGIVVALQVRDSLSHLAWMLALGRSGMPSIAIPGTAWDSSAPELLRRAAAGAIVADEAVNTELPIRIHAGHVLREPVGAVSLTAQRCSDLSRVFVFKASSGTTGVPKLVANTHSDMLASIERERLAIGYPTGERYMTPVMISHDGPRRRFLACLASGGTIVLPPPRANAVTLIRMIKQFDVRHYSCVPIQAYQLAAAMSGQPRLDRLRCLRLSSGPSDRALHAILRERVTPNILVSYGCTEIGPITSASPQMLSQQPDTVGVPMPGVQVEVVDSQGLPVQPNTAGEIRIRATGMPTAYHKDPFTSGLYFRDGWFYPGDMGLLDQAGRLFHLGRADDMMIFNGINISPAEIERVMLTHPAVCDAVAMPIKQPVLHDVPVCVVSLSSGQKISASELIDWSRQHLGARSPKYIAILESIPRNEMGKPIRRDILRELKNRFLRAGKST